MSIFTEDLTCFGKRLSYLRKILKLTQAELARRLGVSSAHISHLEKGRKNPSPQLIKLLVVEIGVCEDWLLHGKGNIFPACGYANKELALEAEQQPDEPCSDSKPFPQANAIAAPKEAYWEMVPLIDKWLAENTEELQLMIGYLIETYTKGDWRLKGWTITQFEKAFPEYKTWREAHKKLNR